jgi:hypothetical protein
MNPPESVNPDYDRGYSAGYRDASVQQVLKDLNEIRFWYADAQEDIDKLLKTIADSPIEH